VNAPHRCITAVVLLLACASMAHVGSPDTFFTGAAGPYPIRVSVRLPGVIPGLAQINVRLPKDAADAVTQVTVRAIQWNLGSDGAPPPDVAQRVPGDPGLFAADLWLMVATSHRVNVEISGSRGDGLAVVPVMALATAQRDMPPALGAMLAALGLFLAVGLLTIVGAAVRESSVPPGETPPPSRTRRAWIAMAIGAIVVAVALAGGRAWWNAEAFAYGESVLYRPFDATASVRAHQGSRVLSLAIDDRRWPPPPGNIQTRYNALMPDHGKLMHMFLVREPALDVFAHVHPVPDAPTPRRFDLRLPPLPAGRYRVFGDIVHESGYAQTLVASADIPDASLGAAGGSPPADPDDSWYAGAAGADAANREFRAADGTTITWEGGAQPTAGEEQMLTFRARDAAGSPVALEPYMGMLGHIAVAHADGSVFAHLHPSGSISMAAWQKFSSPPDPHAAHATEASEIATPYAFPKSGRYRVWVQMKRHGQVMTAAFDADVR
jgi:hypothetical protein